MTWAIAALAGVAVAGVVYELWSRAREGEEISEIVLNPEIIDDYDLRDIEAVLLWASGYRDG